MNSVDSAISAVTDADIILIEEASALINRHWKRDQHGVAAAIRTADGSVFSGLHVGGRRINICGEQVTMGMALSAGHKEFDTCVAVIKTLADEEPAVTSPCGACREVLTWYAPGMRVLVRDGTDVRVMLARELLPAPYIPPWELRGDGFRP